MNTNHPTFNDAESLNERLAKIAKMNPGERRKIGIIPGGDSAYTCPSVYYHDEKSNSKYEYNIGRDC